MTIRSIRFDRSLAGLVFTVGCIALFLAGEPSVGRLFAAAIAFGLLIAAFLHFLNRSEIPNERHLANEEYPHPGITMHRIRFDAGFAGLVFTVGCMALFLAGLPVLWYPFVAALALGAGVGTVLHFLHR